VEVRAIISQTVLLNLIFSIRDRIGRCSAGSSPRPAYSHGNSVYSVHYDEIAVIIYCVLDRRLSSRPGHISHFVVHITHLVDRSRRRFCRAADNTGGMDTPTFRTRIRRLVMERGGPLSPATQRRKHEGMPSLGLVVPIAGRGEAEGSYPKSEHWPLDKRQTHFHELPFYSLRLTTTLQNLLLDSRETTLRRYLPSPKPLVNLRQRGNLANDVSCANCELFCMVTILAHSQKKFIFLDPRSRLFENGRLGHQSAPSQTKPPPQTKPRRHYLCSLISAILATRHSPARVVEVQPRRVGIRQILCQRCIFRCGQPCSLRLDVATSRIVVHLTQKSYGNPRSLTLMV
jgi:hypothetical protein